MPAAQQLIADDITKHLLCARGSSVANYHCLAFVNDEIVDDARVVSGARPTPASGFNLQGNTVISHLEHPTGALEEDASEIGDQTEGVDIDFHVVNHTCQLVALFWAIKLNLVADQVMQWPVPHRQFVKIHVGFDVNRWCTNPEPAGDLVAFAVEAGQQQAIHLPR